MKKNILMIESKQASCACIKQYLPEHLTFGTNIIPGCNYEINDVFLSISNINSIINPNEVPKNWCGQWTGNKELIMLTLNVNYINV